MVSTETKARAGTAQDSLTCGVELHKLLILQWQASTSSHSIAISCAGVGRCGREVCPAIPTSGQDGFMCSDSVKGTILHAQSHDPSAAAVLVHDQVQGKILNCSQKARFSAGGHGGDGGGEGFEGGMCRIISLLHVSGRSSRDHMRKHFLKGR